MAANPDPLRITAELWRLWESRPNTAWRLGGIYANKKGYHNTVTWNLANYPTNYSVRTALDLVQYNRGRARAIDLTMSESEMKKVTGYLKRSALDSRDSRLACVRDFYGTLNGTTVYGLIKDDLDGPWESSSADDTHLWHIHISFFTAYVAAWDALRAVLSVLAGETYEEWSESNDMFLPRQGDSGEAVAYWQHVHNFTRNQVDPPAPNITVDGDYGPATRSAFTDMARKLGASDTYDVTAMTAWLAVRYHRELAKAQIPSA